MVSPETSVTVASLMVRLRSGDREAAAKMRAELSDHSLQPSLFVNELYLQLIKVKSLPAPEDNARSEWEHSLQFAGHVMRHLLIDHSRLLSRRTSKIDIAHFDVVAEEDGATLQEIDNLLDKLASIHPRLRSIVETKVFEGLLVEKIADSLQVAPRTVARNWAFCKGWLREQLKLE